MTSLFPLRVLFLEDSDTYASLIEAAARKAEPVIVLERAKTFEEATATLNGQHVILADLNLPDSHELATVVRLKQLTDMPIIVLSGCEDLTVIQEAILAGAEDFLPKATTQPFTVLAAIVVVASKRLREEAIKRQKQEACREVREDLKKIQIEITGQGQP